MPPATCGLCGFDTKAAAADAIKRHQAAAEECARKLKVLHTDNGGEFTAADFVAYYADEGVQHHYAAPYSPQQNGVVERHNQTVVAAAHAPQAVWHAGGLLGEAVMTAAHLLNRSLAKALDGKTPYEA
jgi:transposase InsO family protein